MCGGDEKWRPPSLPETVELHGLRHACAPGSPIFRRVLWWLVIILAAVLVCYNIAVSVMLYLSYPTTQTTSLRSENSVDFPRVTFCNWNRVQASALRNSNGNPTQTSFPDIFPNALANDPATNWRDVYVNHSQPLADALLSCKMRGSACGGLKIEQEVTPDGICYSYNTGPDELRVSDIKLDVLELELNVQADEYVTPTRGLGFKIFLTEPGMPITSEGVTVNPGRATRLSLKRTTIKRLSPPFGGECSQGDGSDCIACFAAQTVKDCNCTAFYMPADSSVGVCSPEKEQSCVPNAYSNVDCDTNGECNPCTEVIFDYVKDETLIPPSYFTQLSNANAGTTSQYWSENLVRVTIAYLRIEQQVIESHPAYTLAEMMADIGLYLIMLMGCSLITLIEFIDYGIWHLCCPKKKQ